MFTCHAMKHHRMAGSLPSSQRQPPPPPPLLKGGRVARVALAAAAPDLAPLRRVEGLEGLGLRGGPPCVLSCWQQKAVCSTTATRIISHQISAIRSYPGDQ